MTPVFPFLCLCFELYVVVQVDGRLIIDGIGRNRDGVRCVGDGGHHFLSYSRDEAFDNI